MIIDCDTCTVRGDACGDCAVTAFLAGPPNGRLDEAETRALHLLAEAGLLPPLRMTPEPVRHLRPAATTRRDNSGARRRRSA